VAPNLVYITLTALAKMFKFFVLGIRVPTHVECIQAGVLLRFYYDDFREVYESLGYKDNLLAMTTKRGCLNVEAKDLLYLGRL
jgi:hypothetical protein